MLLVENVCASGGGGGDKTLRLPVVLEHGIAGLVY